MADRDNRHNNIIKHVPKPDPTVSVSTKNINNSFSVGLYDDDKLQFTENHRCETVFWHCARAESRDL